MSGKFDPKEYWEKRLARNCDLAGVGYRALGKGFNYWSYAATKHIFKRELARLTKPHAGAMALDIGAGTGFFTKILADTGYQVTGLDISPTAVAELKRKFPSLTFIEGRAQDITGSYDLITAMAVLFHIVDDADYEEALRKIYAALKPGGTFLFSENFPRETARYEHIVMHSERELLDMLPRAGFTVVSRHSFGILMNESIKGRPTFRWKVLRWLLAQAPVLGWIIGAILYPFEIIITLLPYRPSSEIVVCLKS